jgi:hypothetical protein
MSQENGMQQGNVDDSAFIKEHPGLRNAVEINKLKVERDAIKIKLQDIAEQCIADALQSPEMTTAKNDIEQQKAQIKEFEKKKPQRPQGGSASFASYEEYEHAMHQYDNDLYDWEDKLRAMKEKLKQMYEMYRSSEKFIKHACFLEEDALNKFKAYPPLVDRVYSFISQNMRPLVVRIAEIDKSIYTLQNDGN